MRSVPLIAAILFSLSAAFAATAPLRDALYAPAPEYPRKARIENLSGQGVAVMHVDPKTGRVISAEMEKSTGHKILDDAALRAFRQWRFKPGTAPIVRTPVNYAMAPKPIIPRPTADQLRQDLQGLDRLENMRSTSETEFIIACGRLAKRTGPRIIHALMERSKTWHRDVDGLKFVSIVYFLPRNPTFDLLHEYDQSPDKWQRYWADEFRRMLRYKETPVFL